MNQVLTTIIVAMLLLINSFIIKTDDDINELFCQLNEYATARVLNKLNVFPCQQQ